MHTQFRTYHLAVSFYREASRLKAPGHLSNQLLRAASSIVLNLSEGSAKPSAVDRKRFYSIALGSLRECQSCLDLLPNASHSIIGQADLLAAHVYRLTHPRA